MRILRAVHYGALSAVIWCSTARASEVGEAVAAVLDRRNSGMVQNEAQVRLSAFPAEEVIDEVAPFIEAEERRYRLAAVWVLELPPYARTEEGTVLLLNVLKDEDAAMRSAAAAGLRHASPSLEKTVVEELTVKVRDEDSTRVLISVIRTIGALGYDASAREALLDAAGDVNNLPLVFWALSENEGLGEAMKALREADRWRSPVRLPGKPQHEIATMLQAEVYRSPEAVEFVLGDRELLDAIFALANGAAEEAGGRSAAMRTVLLLALHEEKQGQGGEVRAQELLDRVQPRSEQVKQEWARLRSSWAQALNRKE